MIVPLGLSGPAEEGGPSIDLLNQLVTFKKLFLKLLFSRITGRLENKGKNTISNLPQQPI